LVLKYNDAHSAVITLGCPDTGEDDDYPSLSEADTTIKTSEQPCQLGNGKHLGGGALLMAGIGKKVVLPNEPGIIYLPKLVSVKLKYATDFDHQPARQTYQSKSW
jgi:hypothetical protein